MSADRDRALKRLSSLSPAHMTAHILSHEFGHLLVFDMEHRLGGSQALVDRLEDLGYLNNVEVRGLDLA